MLGIPLVSLQLAQRLASASTNAGIRGVQPQDAYVCGDEAHPSPRVYVSCFFMESLCITLRNS